MNVTYGAYDENLTEKVKCKFFEKKFDLFLNMRSELKLSSCLVLVDPIFIFFEKSITYQKSVVCEIMKFKVWCHTWEIKAKDHTRIQLFESNLLLVLIFVFSLSNEVIE